MRGKLSITKIRHGLVLHKTLVVVPLDATHAAPPFDAAVVTTNVCAIVPPPPPQLCEHVLVGM